MVAWEVEEGGERGGGAWVCVCVFDAVFDEGGSRVRGMMAHDLVMDWARRVVIDEGSVA